MKVLLVEDNIINQRIIVLNLNKLGYTVDIASNGEEAVDLFKKEKYGLILMDIMMPVMDGIEATREIRKIEKPEGKRIPIIALTANALNSDRENCINSGMDEYMTKPFDLNLLKEYIQKLKIQSGS